MHLGHINPYLFAGRQQPNRHETQEGLQLAARVELVAAGQHLNQAELFQTVGHWCDNCSPDEAQLLQLHCELGEGMQGGLLE